MLARGLYDDSFFPPQRKRHNNGVRGSVAHLCREWFDCSENTQSITIKNNQPEPRKPSPTDSDSPAQTTEKENA